MPESNVVPLGRLLASPGRARLLPSPGRRRTLATAARRRILPDGPPHGFTALDPVVALLLAGGAFDWGDVANPPTEAGDFGLLPDPAAICLEFGLLP
jgi:hypothetical protein